MTVTAILASVATVLGVVISDGFLNFLRAALSNRLIQGLVIASLTAGLTVSYFKNPSFYETLAGRGWPPPGGVLRRVQSRPGDLRCGINGFLVGFSKTDSEQPGNRAQGFDVDFCRAVAAAITGNSENVLFVPIRRAAERFTKVEKGDVDVLFRNTSWSADRDLNLKVDFGPPIYYDEPAILFRVDSGIQEPKNLSERVICVLPGTTTYLNVDSYLDKEGATDYRLKTQQGEGVDFETNEQVIGNYLTAPGVNCDAVASDLSQLLIYFGQRSDLSEYIIWDDLDIARELLSPVIVEGDAQWKDVITYVVYATIRAAELGIDKNNIDQRSGEGDPLIDQFLNKDAIGLDRNLGIRKDYAYQIVRSVGNYDDIYTEHLSPYIPERGLNQLWKEDKGVLTSPPLFQKK